jgi:hypothetical protein
VPPAVVYGKPPMQVLLSNPSSTNIVRALAHLPSTKKIQKSFTLELGKAT